MCISVVTGQINKTTQLFIMKIKHKVHKTGKSKNSEKSGCTEQRTQHDMLSMSVGVYRLLKHQLTADVNTTDLANFALQTLHNARICLKTAFTKVIQVFDHVKIVLETEITDTPYAAVALLYYIYTYTQRSNKPFPG